MRLRRLKPLALYLISIGCILVSRIFEDYDLEVIQYLFVFAGFFFFILAVWRYFTRKS